MRALPNLRLAFRALRSHKLRTALTSLGIVIGVAAVIAMMAVGAGARERVAEQIRSMGTNLVLVWAKPGTVGGARVGARPAVTEEDAWAIQREIPVVDAAAPFSTSRVRLVHRNQNWTTVLNAVTSEFHRVHEWDVIDGRAISQDEADASAKVIVLGRTVAGNLFGEAEPIGETVRVQNVPFTVVGVLDGRGQSAFGQDQDDIALIPLSTARRNVIGRKPLTARAVESITVKISDVDLIPAAMQEIRAALRQRHQLQPEQEDDFVMQDLTEMTRVQESSSRVLAMLIAAIASVSLVSGGVGIMNIMLVSVTERTREIGVRVAVGARTRDIFSQFLVEALTLALGGGLVGVGVGLGVTHAVSYVASWRVLIEPQAVLLALGFAIAVGVVFGVYPARKAARLDPIDALRFE
jgi:putative ABC transport system permease protein